MLNIGAVLLLLIGMTDGLKTFCNATKSSRTPCFGSPGGTLEVQLDMTSSGILYELKRNNVPIYLFDHEIINTNLRFSMNYSTRILTMKDLHSSDNGLYSMGDLVCLGFKTDYFYLSIEAPVSSPLLSRECLSRGQQRVSCAAEGDGPHYSWSLDGLPLNATRLLSGPSNASDITLEPGLSGLITCSVRNNVSAAAATFTLSLCDDPIPIIARFLTVVGLLLVALAVYWALKKKKTSRPQDIPLSSMAGDDDGLYVNISRATGGAGGD
ncbi:uncharacterized protein LOC115550361 isoform X1 [Gadus morhua]|uniref:uncharacterized protein LOC115550361 isoform X1 n=1 Tax=Gadus morhua TaxID=8049 RepID=UPI0011B4BA93|nr:uncharacterized protein LOC115550361 isoform X1 [Gadus morhua]XP_030221159.1 uncharacterized protein LOC115550361 isoform X1 [Gadus morhua]